MKTSAEIRLDNLNAIVGKYPSQAAFAVAIGKDRRQVNQWWGKGSARGLGDAVAREIEAALGLEHGWMDNIHTANETAVSPSQPERLNSEMLAATHRLLREAHKDAGKTYSVEADPDLFSVVYEHLRGLGPAPSPTKLADVRSQIDAEISDGRAKQPQRTSRPDSGSGKKRSTA